MSVPDHWTAPVRAAVPPPGTEVKVERKSEPRNCYRGTVVDVVYDDDEADVMATGGPVFLLLDYDHHPVGDGRQLPTRRRWAIAWDDIAGIDRPLHDLPPGGTP
jgi:hypothetical protein